MTVLDIPTARVFRPLLEPSRYKGAYGGRGSGKSHFFADLIVEEHVASPGLRSVCIREVLKSLKQSAKLLIEDKIQSLNVGHLFEVQKDKINAPGGGIIIFEGMQDHNAESIKSLEGFDRCWVEEAQTLSETSLSMLRPTLRKDGSEIWFSWNPRRKKDAVDQFLRGEAKVDGSVIVKANWRDNPWFPGVLENERQIDLVRYPERYDHIWEGDYAKAFEGAYFARLLNEARAQKRIGFFPPDPLIQDRAFWDIGGSGATADAMAIWIVQWIDGEIRVLDYIEGVGQILSYYVNELRRRKWHHAIHYLPHDGVNENNITGKRYYQHLVDAGLEVMPPIPNQGRGAAMMRVEAVRRILPMCRFNEEPTEAGRDALGYYHERKDETRNIGLGPDHDWSSHCFTGDTEVLTRYGTYPFKNLPLTGEVLTPCGWRPYRNPRITRKDARLVAVTFDDGFSVKCTPDHLFLTVNGWKSAESLQTGSLIQSTLMHSPNTSMAVFIESGRAITTLAGVAASYIEMFGSWLSEKYRKVVTSIIVMRTRSITPLQILSAWKPESILALHGGMVPSRNTNQASTSARLPDRKLPSGMGLRLAGFGIDGTQSVPRVGLSGSVSRVTAQNVVLGSMLSSAKAAMRRFIAAKLARLRPIASANLGMSGPRRIATVRNLNQTADVWCLTVPDAECFSLANGAVVHNCSDAFGLMAICYEGPDGPLSINNMFDFDRMSADASRSSITGY